MTRSRVGTR
uniref:Uncharacterized protein n=1 Tax=Arundo donax TaxID=35708 RepID=A0A0A8ZW59_ARUDO